MDRIRASKNFAKNLIYPRGEGEKAGGGGGVSIEPGFISHSLPIFFVKGLFLYFFSGLVFAECCLILVLLLPLILGRQALSATQREERVGENAKVASHSNRRGGGGIE
jgi:hypothetical protein